LALRVSGTLSLRTENQSLRAMAAVYARHKDQISIGQTNTACKD